MENGNAVRKKSGSASKKGKKEERKVIQPNNAEEEPVVCQRNMDMKKIEETQDCFILGFDPFHSDDAHLSAPSVTAEQADLLLVSQKGLVVACRDYPHSRHQCVQFPFQETPHERYCQLCYCYVCDSAALASTGLILINQATAMPQRKIPNGSCGGKKREGDTLI